MEPTTVDLSGRRALVTGAASRIGFAVADCLARSGADVLMVDLAGDRLREQAAAVPGASARPADLSVRSDVHRILAVALISQTVVWINPTSLRRRPPKRFRSRAGCRVAGARR